MQESQTQPLITRWTWHQDAACPDPLAASLHKGAADRDTEPCSHCPVRSPCALYGAALAAFARARLPITLPDGDDAQDA